jgi:hypothetical protein
METIPQKCATINTVRSFCECIAGEDSVDVAAKGFCAGAQGRDTAITGDELAELKKALMDLESRKE